MILIKTKILCFLFVISLCLFCASQVQAQISKLIQTQYFDTYIIEDSRQVKVKKQIDLTLLQPDIYISEYQINFHSSSGLSDLMVFEDGEQAQFTQTVTESQTIISIKLNEPKANQRQTKTIILSYILKNYVNQSGLSQELLLPLSLPSQNEQLLNYEVKVVTPKNFPNLGISKPRVKQIDSQTFLWSEAQNLGVKALYLSFSDKAFFQVDFNYHLFNPASYAQELAAALVPDGTYQKAYLEHLEPEPDRINLDVDGNLLAYYQVKPKQVLRIRYSGLVELFNKPRMEVNTYQQLFVPNLNTRYLTQEKYWALNSRTLSRLLTKNLNNSKAIYNYVINYLEYGLTRLNTDLKREGAQWAIDNPNQAVCMEYTDLFIALSRENGIPSRGVVGYGLTTDTQILPRSFLGDVLHAWPEYFDSARQVWLAVDPTWEDTSGLDYFSSLDLNHIAFVYHGKNPDSPLPPGAYKLNPKDQDIRVNPTSQKPKAKLGWQVEWPKQLLFNTNQNNRFSMELHSLANVILYQTKLDLQDKNSGKILASQTLMAIAPLSTQTIIWQLEPKNLQQANRHILQLVINQKVVSQKSYSVLSPFWYFLKSYGFWFILPVLVVFSLLWRKWR